MEKFSGLLKWRVTKLRCLNLLAWIILIRRRESTHANIEKLVSILLILRLPYCTKKSAWNNCTGVCFGFVKIADSVMTQLILSNEYLCVIFTLFGEKKFLFKQNICMLFKCSIDTETAHQLLSNYSQMTSCIEFINLSPEPIQNYFNTGIRKTCRSWNLKLGW